MCSVYEYVSMLRCYECGGFNHVSNDCKVEAACLNSRNQEYEIDDCPLDQSCINCIRMNKNNGNADLDVNHSRFHYVNKLKEQGKV